VTAADPFVRQLLDAFLLEAQEVTGRLTRDVIALEHGPKEAELPALYESLSRGLHNLKGSAATIGLDDVARLAHELEEIVTPLARQKLPLPNADADRLLTELDLLLRMVRTRVEGGKEPAGAPAPVDAEVDAGAWRVGSEHVRALVREVERLRELHLRLADRRDREEAGEIVGGLEESVKALCTQQVGAITEPLHRAVRDLRRASGKEARLSVVGGEISLDRRLLEALRPALVQLVRNAVDHGIEAPEARLREGKHREGLIVIRVELRGNLVFVEVSDDGRGLDLDAIREAARKQGIATDERTAADDRMSLVFRSGFSTRSEATSTSGRGVGLDLVRTQVDALRGRIEMASTPGHGTRFTMTLPSTMGSSPVVLARCGGQTFALPLQVIEGVVSATGANFIPVGATAKIDHRGRVLPLDDLGALLGLRSSLLEGAGEPVLVVHAHAKRAALRVDEVISEIDLRIRPLPDEIRETAAYDGASTLPSGELVLVLRPEWIVGAGARTAEAPPLARRALVVDDSLTARAVHRSMLEAGGFVVHAVPSAEQALERLGRGSYDVIVCDVAMEPMGGLALTALVRGRNDWGRIPVILVSAHDSAENRAAALSAGADGFLSKAECAQGRLLSEVAAVMARRRETGS
jgi:two-component system, chemotaxis family, sensor kinase CheA